MRFVCVLLLAAISCAAANDRRSRLLSTMPEIDGYFEKYWRDRKIPGLVYGVVIDGELVHVKAFGVRDRRSNDPVTADTVFRIASMTKSFTALAILKLRDEGKLSLEDPVAKWIPEFARMPLPTRDSPPIRVRNLLTHTAGLPEDNPWGDQQLGISDETLTEWLKKGIPFSNSPDTGWEYSNYGFALLGRIIQAASGMSYRDYLESQILRPLAMTSSTLEPSAAPPDRVAHGYRPNGSMEPSLPHGAFGAMGGLLTSARDLAKYVAFQLSAWPPRDEPDRGPVRRSSLREMQNMASLAHLDPGESLRAVGYGYGLMSVQDCKLGRVVSHGGGLPGFGSSMLWLPEYGVGIIAMANLTYAGPHAPTRQAIQRLLKTGAMERRSKPATPALADARERIIRLWNNWSDSEADALAAMNLKLDAPWPERREQVEKLRKELGVCEAPGPMEAWNALRGRFLIECEKGTARVFFTLAPTNPPRVQQLEFKRHEDKDPPCLM